MEKPIQASRVDLIPCGGKAPNHTEGLNDLSFSDWNCDYMIAKAAFFCSAPDWPEICCVNYLTCMPSPYHPANQSEVACCSWTGHANQLISITCSTCSLISEMSSSGPEAELGDLIPKKNNTLVIWEYLGFEAADVHQKQVLCHAKLATSSGNQFIPALKKSPHAFAWRVHDEKARWKV